MNIKYYFNLLVIISCNIESTPFEFKNGQYTGQHNDRIPNGIGTLVFSNKDIYSGSFVNGEITGEGIYTFYEGTRYEGEFLNGKFDGNGKLDSLNGSIYQGEFKNGVMSGIGILTYSNGTKYDGQWLNGQRHGIGKFIYYIDEERKEYNGAWQFDEMSQKGDNELQDLFEQRKNSVFTIYAITDSFPLLGSGFFINEEGIGLTNFHILGKAKAAFLKTNDGKKYDIKEVIAENENLDFLIFRIFLIQGEKCHAVPIAKELPVIGSNCFTISSPIGMSNTLSNGIVSQYRGFENTLIQTSTPIDHGSSGSPLFNHKGEVIGINTLKIESSAGLNFAINILKILDKAESMQSDYRKRFIDGNYDELMNEYNNRVDSLEAE